MPKSYRHYVLVAFGWLFLWGANAGHSASQSTTGNQGTAQTEIAKKANKRAVTDAATTKPSATQGHDSGCPDRKERRDSDLCAQWKSADASADAARTSEKQVRIGWVGVVLGFITMLSAIAAARFAWRAAVATEESAQIAKRASNIADNASKRQLRAYLGIRKVTTKPLPRSYQLMIQNYGQTPATDVRFHAVAVVEGAKPRVETHNWGHLDPGYRRYGVLGIQSIFGRTGEINKHLKIDFELTYVDIDGVAWMRQQSFKIAPNSPDIGDRAENEPFHLHMVSGRDNEIQLSMDEHNEWKQKHPAITG